jgi:sugar phosphate isomerase/epimerase
MHVAFSTLACPDWTLDRIARAAGQLAYDSVELRTFGFGPPSPAASLLYDPALTDPLKTRRVLGDHGVSAACLATSLTFDRTIFPPVLGRAITDQERETRTAKRLIDLAAAMDCPSIRVFAFEIQGRESRKSAIRRIVWRLSMAVDAARNTGVRVLLENAGSFATAGELTEILDQISSPALAVAYSVPAARHAGEDPIAALDALGDRAVLVRLKGHNAGKPCLLADGDDPSADVVRSLAARRYTGTLVYEYDRLWHDNRARATMPEPETALRHAIESIYSWMARSTRRPSHAGSSPVALHA